MIADNQTNMIYFSDLIRTDSKYSETCGQITKILDLYNVGYLFLDKTKDIWARDYMPIQVSEDKFIEYRYDPDYLQGDEKGYRDLKTYPDIVCDSINLKTTKTDIILDGGNVIKSKNCVILTDKIVKENRLVCGKTELIKRLEETFEVDNVILIPWDRESEYGHSDGMIRFIDEETVLIHEIYEPYKNIQQQLKQHGLKWEFLRFNGPKYNEDKWPYINFLQTKDLILLPKLNIDEDELALSQIQMYFPEYAEKDRIVLVVATQLVEKDGAFNCISWTIKSK
ncbi:MAG TPA: hypothetical protein DCL77_14855 [Prolixibacteraceae bacterium]|jgi:agmatine/peptidylarginine deiminase|nr:hypothetical protein [Prolixibacteraceae bacterium]